MGLPSLGALKRIDVRNIWQTEAYHFTPWLAQNLDILAETLDMELEIEAQEKNVGPFRADILCKDTLDNSWVLIENQLERTDHTHLGQLMTYASGLQAVKSFGYLLTLLKSTAQRLIGLTLLRMIILGFLALKWSFGRLAIVLWHRNSTLFPNLTTGHVLSTKLQERLKQMH